MNTESTRRSFRHNNCPFRFRFSTILFSLFSLFTLVSVISAVKSNLSYDVCVKINSYLSYLIARARQEVGMVLQVGKAKTKYMCVSGFPTLAMFLARP